MSVELIYDRDCPNVLDARANLVKALATSGREERWTEWDRSAPDSPPHIRGYGSPTVLVDGKDAAGDSPMPIPQTGPDEGSPSCRLYRNGAGRASGIPSVEQIAAALDFNDGAATIAPRRPAGWGSSLAAAPGIAFAFLPKLACPLCWPAYAGLLGSLGLGFLIDETYLFPLTASFLVLAAVALAFRARSRRGYGPFALGFAASAVVLTGKFAFNSNAAMYGGIAVLVAASVWNAWPVRNKAAGCTSCVPDPSSTVSSTLQKETAS